MDVVKHATYIVKKLVKAGYIAYFAGGWVRDYVLGHPSEDIDIATNASPAEIMDLFPQTILVGLAFGVVIVIIEGHQFEVATFRKDLQYKDGRHPEGVKLYATPQEDAYRRDFTINGMFYDPLEDLIHDYVHGREDLKKGVIRTIGNPHERFFEDRLRMLRAFRFAARFRFFIDPETQQAIYENADSLFPAVAMERVWQEFNKMSAYPGFDQALVEMHRSSLLDVIFPELANMHIQELRHLVRAYHYFPLDCPTILYLMELFPSIPLEQKIEVSKRIKASNRDIKLIEFMEKVTEASKSEQKGESIDDYQWVQLFAQNDFQLCLAVLAARYPDNERQQFLQHHQDRLQRLRFHVDRLKTGKPLVSAALLQQHGIYPGKQMGLLLKEAEKIAINENLQHPASIMEKLVLIPFWKLES